MGIDGERVGGSEREWDSIVPPPLPVGSGSSDGGSELPPPLPAKGDNEKSSTPPPLPAEGAPVVGGEPGFGRHYPPPLPVAGGTCEAPRRWVPLSLFNTDVSMAWYVLTRGLVSLIPSLAIGLLLAQTGILNEDTGPEFEGPIALMLFSVWVLSPVIETFLMAGILWLVSLTTRNKIAMATISAIIWGVFHSLFAPAWGVTVAWPFFVFSCGYLAWKEKGWWYGILAATLLHAFQNFLPGWVILFQG